MHQMLEKRIRFNNWMKFGLMGISTLYIIATLALPFVGMKAELLKPLLSKDPFAQANLDAVVNWTGMETIAGIFLLLVVGVSVNWIGKQSKMEQGFFTLYAGTATFVLLTLIFFIGRIELYSQGAAIRFFESLKGTDSYVITDGYKSYAQLFYTGKPPVVNQQSYNKDWLLYGDIDKDVYVVTKINHAHNMKDIPGLEKLKEENGFVFFRRKANR
jgi:hypothetical protein